MTANNRKRAAIIAGAIALLTVALYLPVLRNGFVAWDDDLYVTANRHIRTLSGEFFRWAFTDYTTTGNWHPVTWISYAIDHAFWGLDPRGYHLTGILLHAANAFLVVLVLVRLLEASSGIRARSGLAPLLDDRSVLIAAGAAGFLFAVHPLHVEPAVWAADRRDLLCTFFFLLSIGSYCGHALARAGMPEAAGSSRRFSFLTFVLFLFAIASKSMAGTLPAVLLLLDWYPLNRVTTMKQAARSFAEKVPYVAVSICVALVTMLGQREIGATKLMETVPLASRMLVAASSLMAYLGQMVLPIRLLPFYAYPGPQDLTSFPYLFAAVLAGAVTAATLVVARSRPVWTAVWGFYIITLLPVLNIVQIGTHARADRYVYLPSIGPFALAGILAARVWTRSDVLRLRKLAKGAAVVLALSLCTVLSFLTIRQIALWNDSVTLWSYVIENDPLRVPIAYNNRGLALKAAGKTALALEDFETAIRIDPRYAVAYINRGLTYRDAGRFDQAALDYEKAISLDPKQHMAYLHRGLLHGEMGRHAQAAEDLTAALTIAPDLPDAYVGRGLARAEMGQLPGATEDLDRAIALDPKNADAYLNRGVVFQRSKEYARAIADYSKVIELEPSDGLAYSNRGIVYGKINDCAKALDDLSRAQQLGQRLVQASLDRGTVFFQCGDIDRAREEFSAACAGGSGEGCIRARSVGQPRE